MRSIAPTFLAAALLAAGGGTAQAHHQRLVLQLNAPPRAEFAGYYAADYQGFYDEAEVSISIVPGGPGVDPTRALADGAADLIVARMPAALKSRERGVPLVNIGQFFQRAGMELVCRADSGVEGPSDLRGRTLGVWSDDDRHAMLAWLAGLGLAAGDVRIVDQGHEAALLLDRRADCISAMSYGEHAQLLDAGVRPEDLVVLRLEEHGQGAALEDGIWVLETALADPETAWYLAAFLYASRRGWEWAQENPVEAVRVMEEYDLAGTLEEEPQVHRMREVNRLTAGATGRLDPAAYERTVAMLLAAAPERAITRPPTGAWTHSVADTAGLGGGE
jgi:NitT/TauT family transport system substrate-binding protein